MSETSVTMVVRPAGPLQSIIDVRGDLTGAAEDALMSAYAAAAGARGIVLNFSELGYMNSTGIGLLVTLLVRGQAPGPHPAGLLPERALPAHLRADAAGQGHPGLCLRGGRRAGGRRGLSGGGEEKSTMTTTPDTTQPPEHQPDAAWAPPIERLTLTGTPAGAINLNVDGRRVNGPLQGFGQMWQKTYRVRLAGSALEPREIIQTWKERFPDFWPPGNRFYAPLADIAPGEVALVNLSMPGGAPLSTGVLVLYADAESFTLMTPEGHIFSGWITFSAERDGDDATAQAQVLMRANDPLYELGLALGGHRQEDEFWRRTLAALARRLGTPDAVVETRVVRVDARRQWSRAGNIWHNAALRTLLAGLTRPLRRCGAGETVSRRDEG